MIVIEFWLELHPLQWRHNERDGMLDHRRLDCLLNCVFEAQIQGNIKAPCHWPVWGEFTVHRWIPRTKGQWRGFFSICWRHHEMCSYVSTWQINWLRQWLGTELATNHYLKSMSHSLTYDISKVNSLTLCDAYIVYTLVKWVVIISGNGLLPGVVLWTNVNLLSIRTNSNQILIQTQNAFGNDICTMLAILYRVLSRQLS